MLLTEKRCWECGNRLSVVDTDGVCMFCREASPVRAGSPGGVVKRRTAQADAMREKWSSPVFHDMMVEKIAAGRARAEAGRAAIWAIHEERTRDIPAIRAARARRSSAAKAAWASPEKRAAILAGQKARRASE